MRTNASQPREDVLSQFALQLVQRAHSIGAPEQQLFGIALLTPVVHSWSVVIFKVEGYFERSQPTFWMDQLGRTELCSRIHFASNNKAGFDKPNRGKYIHYIAMLYLYTSIKARNEVNVDTMLPSLAKLVRTFVDSYSITRSNPVGRDLRTPRAKRCAHMHLYGQLLSSPWHFHDFWIRSDHPWRHVQPNHSRACSGAVFGRIWTG